MGVTIDGIAIEISRDDKNIVDIADRANIGIPAPCYRTNKAKGFCNSCVVEIAGKKANACVTKPLDGMNIIVNRDDLKKIEDENIIKYKESFKPAGKDCECNCSDEKKRCH